MTDQQNIEVDQEGSSMRISQNGSRIQLAGWASSSQRDGRLVEFEGFGSNPGNLRALHYVPASPSAPMPLVVVLHGCTQTASAYDQGSGWSTLADRLGFMLLFPEQRRANNPNLCFNWFQASDTRRGQGEVASIRQMIEHLCSDFLVDRTRIFCTGLSAGGAMTSAMLATYPEIFAAGAVIAGLPYTGATSVTDAFALMNGRVRLSSSAAVSLVRAASNHSGPWPRVSVWHGTADSTVVGTNGDDIVTQWRGLHALPATPTSEDRVDGFPHRLWGDAAGRKIVEQYILTGIGHGTPLSPGLAEGQSGVAGAFMLDAAISSTDRIADFFGIADVGSAQGEMVAEPRGDEARMTAEARLASVPVGDLPNQLPPKAPRAMRKVAGVQQVIENALRAAGLMR